MTRHHASEEVMRRAQLGGRLTPGRRPAILVVDFQLGFTDPESPLGSDLTPQLQATLGLLDQARELDLPVIFTTIGFEPSLSDGGAWMRKMPALSVLRLDTPYVEIDPRLERRRSEPIVVKKGASGFFGTSLSTLLAAADRDTVVVCGTTTSGCVRATAVDLVQHGWTGLVPEDCVGDRSPEAHEASIADLDAKYVDVTTARDVRAYLDSLDAAPRGLQPSAAS
jgi:maleamate amidohydrolase